MRVCALFSCAAVFSCTLFGQPADPERKFEAADIQSSPRAIGGIPPIVRGPFYIPGRYELHFATMADLVSAAYGVDTEKVVGGPSWLEMDRFDVVAKTPQNTTAESRKLMLQSMLADRFKLVVRKDSKPMPAWALTVTKKSLLKEADGATQTGCDFNVTRNAPPPPPPPSGGSPSPPQAIQLPVLEYTCHNTTMAAFAAALPSVPGANQYFDNRPVVDQTELPGSFDFTLKFTPKVPAGINATGENMPLLDAIDKQLGLKLEAATVPVPVINVVSVDEKPTANPPDIAKLFPPLPTEFDVAEVKPSAPATPGRGEARAEVKNGRLYVPGITLQNLIQICWDLPDADHLIGAPKWLNDDRFDIIAKAPPGVALGELVPSSRSIPFNIDALRPMLQTLVIDRFKLKVHTEERPLPAYTLTASKPKLKPADPTSRTNWHEGIDAGTKEKNANPSLGRLVTCQNVSMAQFAEMLRTIAPGYIRTDVIDATGLQGGWDFTFSFSPAGALQQLGVRDGGGGGTTNSSGVGEAVTPNGAISLFDAVQKQLGLKLEMQKRPSTVLVIDHVEQKPAEN